MARLPDLPEWARFALVLAVGVVGFGLADFFAARAGYPALGAYVWAVGYAGVVILAWLVWVRPIDFEPP